MRKTFVVVATSSLMCFAAVTAAATRTLNCGGVKTITGELARLNPGDVLQVSGVCTENVVVPAHVNSVRIDGLGSAIVEAPATGGAVFSVRGRAVRITGFTIRNGGEGVQVIDGGFAWIDNNTVEGNSGLGLNIGPMSTARVWSNLIRNNGDYGINVTRAASVLIGMISLNDATASPNTITGNAGGGILVSRSSHASIFGNTISGNGQQGVSVSRGAQADIASNVISNNAGNGVEASRNSAVALGDANLTGPRFDPNSGSGNGGYGAQCTGGGHIAGRLGTLTGNAGQIDTTACSGIVGP